jgi:16S rRNA (uracil1498-N3)-methyltransferase
VAHIPRLYVPGHVAPGPFSLPAEQAKRLSAVMRAAPGDELLLFAGDGREWHARVESAAKGSVLVRVEGPSRQVAPPAVVLETWIATIRANRFELALEKCTEAGADVFRPVTCEFSQRGDAPSPAKVERWQRIVVEAAEQCGRLYLPVLQGAAKLEQALDVFQGAIVFGDREGVALDDTRRLLPASGHLALVVGPEGGFSPAEVATLRRRGGLAVSFGPYVLRSETAAIAGTALLRSLTS